MYFFVSFLSAQVLYEDNEMTVSITSDHILRLHLTASVSFHVEFFFWVSYSLDSSNKQRKTPLCPIFPFFFLFSNFQYYQLLSGWSAPVEAPTLPSGFPPLFPSFVFSLCEQMAKQADLFFLSRILDHTQ